MEPTNGEAEDASSAEAHGHLTLSNFNSGASMNSIKSALSSFVRDEDGASASEYAVLVALVVVAVAAAVSAFNLTNIYEVVSAKVIDCVNGAATC